MPLGRLATSTRVVMEAGNHHIVDHLTDLAPREDRRAHLIVHRLLHQALLQDWRRKG